MTEAGRGNGFEELSAKSARWPVTEVWPLWLLATAYPVPHAESCCLSITAGVIDNCPFMTVFRELPGAHRPCTFFPPFPYTYWHTQEETDVRDGAPTHTHTHLLLVEKCARCSQDRPHSPRASLMATSKPPMQLLIWVYKSNWQSHSPLSHIKGGVSGVWHTDAHAPGVWLPSSSWSNAWLLLLLASSSLQAAAHGA